MLWRMEEGAPCHVKQRGASRGSCRWSDMCSLGFGKHRTDKKNCESEQSKRQERATGTRQEWSRVSYGPMNRKERELWTSLKGTLRTRIPLPHESPLQSPSEGISKKPTDVPTESKRKHWITAKVSVQDHNSTNGFLLILCPAWDHFWKVKNSTVREKLVSRKKPTTALYLPWAFRPKKYWAGMEGDVPSE